MKRSGQTLIFAGAGALGAENGLLLVEQGLQNRRADDAELDLVATAGGLEDGHVIEVVRARLHAQVAAAAGVDSASSPSTSGLAVAGLGARPSAVAIACLGPPRPVAP